MLDTGNSAFDAHDIGVQAIGQGVGRELSGRICTLAKVGKSDFEAIFTEARGVDGDAPIPNLASRPEIRRLACYIATKGIIR
jgi:hypothetical protein